MAIEVDALVRRPGSEPAGTTAIAGDLGDAASVAAAVAASAPDAVLHLAAEIASQRDEARIRAVNVDGTRALIEACKAAGSPRIVFTSTVVTGDAGGRLLSEDEPLPVATPYGRSKQEGERMLAESELPYVIVRPSHVYGPGGWYADELIAQLRKPGRFCVIGRGDNLWDVVHVDDVVSALVCRARVGAGGGDLPLRRRRADHLLRLHGAERRDARARQAAAGAGGAGPGRGGRQRGRRGRSLGPLEQREAAGGRVGSRPIRARRPGCLLRLAALG